VSAATLHALAGFPARLEASYAAFPAAYVRWQPASWDGVPGEAFNAIEHVCHVRDIEVDGYQVRLRRALTEDNPVLDTLDGYALARERAYGQCAAGDALARFRLARAETLRQLSGLSPAAYARPAFFAEHGALTVRSLVHLLASHDQQHLAGLQWLAGKIDASTVVERH